MRSFDRLIRALRRLPGVGPRQAERFANYFLKSGDSEADEFITALTEVRENIHLCRNCFSYAEDELCEICQDSSRDEDVICVVEEPQNIEAIEKTGAFRGKYHVLHGSISPIEGKTAGNIKLKELIEKIHNSPQEIKEIIIATDPDTEGENTALYLADALSGLAGKITRIGYGVPLGGDINYIDEMTLAHSLRSRTKI
ncbi:recombination protein RecR [Parelusimicrobium proximum]|uniref:recombination mediator RecR n=1 Tax=Parelusimicrobium proximum TaxID=3228953 RepID=UPI003D17A46C